MGERFLSASYGFRPARSVHHAIRTVKLQLLEGDEQRTAGAGLLKATLPATSIRFIIAVVKGNP